jgi:hypothetical protein
MPTTKQLIIVSTVVLLMTAVAIVVMSLSARRLRDPALVARENALLARLDDASSIKVQIIADVWQSADRGDPVLAKVMSLLKEAIANGSTGTPRGAPLSEVLVLKEDGSVSLKIELYFRHMVVDGLVFAGDGAQVHWLAEKAFSRKVHFYPSGARKAEGIYDRGRKHGRWTYFYETGAKQSQGEYDQGNKEGEWLYWDRAGNIQKRQTYRRGHALD